MSTTRPLTMVLAAAMAAAAFIGVIAAISGDDAATPGAAAADEPPNGTRLVGGRIERDLSRATFDTPWPLVAGEATITCRDRGIATVITSTGEYSLTGQADAAGYPELWDAWLDSDTVAGTKVDLSALVQAATALCK